MSTALAQANQTMPTVAMTFDNMRTLAADVAKSGLFGCKTPESALTLMMLAQSEGKHPIQAMREYHIIQNRPSMRADAMQARFQQAGGKIRWIKRTDQEVTAEFSHPELQPEPIMVTWDDEKVRNAGLTNLHKTYPLAMKSARVISEGVRAIMPGVVVGLYTPEEVSSFDEPQTPQTPRRVTSTTVEPAPEKQPEPPAPEAPKPFATPEQVTEMVELLKVVPLKPGQADAWLKKAGANGWSDMPSEAIEKCLVYLREHKKEPAKPEDTLEETLAKLNGKELEQELYQVGKAASGVGIGTFSPGMARYVKNVLGDSKTLGDLNPKQRADLCEALGNAAFDFEKGAIREPAAA